MRLCLCIALLCCTVGLSVGCAATQPDETTPTTPAALSAGPLTDDWYRVAINGQACGYARYAVTRRGDRLTTVYEESLVESHGGEPLEKYFRSTWEETVDHQPVRLTIEQRDGAAGVVQTYTFTGSGIEQVTRQGDRRATTTLKLPPGGWLTPARFDAVLHAVMVAGKTRIALEVWDPQVGAQPYTVVYSAPQEGERVEQPDGSVVEATRWRVEYSYLPGMPAYEYYDAEYRPVQYAMDLGGGAVLTRTRADASVARAAFDPPEMADRSIIRPDRPIRDIRQVRLAVYELSFGDAKAGHLAVLPPSTHRQRVERLGDRRARLTIDLDTVASGAQDDRLGDEHLAATIAVDHRDPAVRELAERVAGRLDRPLDLLAYAEACERFVAGYLRGQTLSVGSATASEAARTGQGDCTECAVLLAAMLRAKGIPSRCVYGLAYTDEPFLGQRGVFVFHMWTQAWIDTQGPDQPASSGYWLDLDAAMGGYSAGHLALGLSAMGEDAQADAIRLVPMTADLSIRVIRDQR